MSRCEAIVLAAGQGTRMHSSLPKVLQPIAGRPMLAWSVEACRAATGGDPYVVVPPDAEAIRNGSARSVRFVEQSEPLGTGHAALQVSPELNGKAELVLVTSADLPLITAESMARLVEAQRSNSGPLAVLSGVSGESRGFGRLIRDEKGNVVEIVEEALATPEQLAVTELNVGAYCFDATWLWETLEHLPLSEKGEYFLTDLVAMASGPVAAVPVEHADEVIGVNTMEHLAEAEGAARKRINSGLMRTGVRLIDPANTYVDVNVRIGPGTVIRPNTTISGTSTIGLDCDIGPNSVLHDVTIGDRCQVDSSHLQGAELGSQVHIGPFARLRPGAVLHDEVHVGNFGEIKNSVLRRGAKVGHFSYLGDATIGEDANIGAGTITCNFDGKQKHSTVVGAGAFIGSDTMLVAPVTIGAGAKTGAGAVVIGDVPDRSLAVGVPARVIKDLDADD